MMSYMLKRPLSGILLAMAIAMPALAVDAVPPEVMADVEQQVADVSAGYLDLLQLYRDAMAADPRILAAEGRLQSGEGMRMNARGQLLPQLSASGSYQRTDRRVDPLRDMYNGERYAVNLNQVLFNASAWRSYQRYKALKEQRVAEQQAAKSDAAVDLAQRYFAALAAEDEMALTQAERRAMQRNLEQVNSLYERRMTKVTDVLQISARVDALVAREIEATNAVAVSRAALAELVGYPVDRRLERIRSGAEFTPPSRDNEWWVAAALASNPSLAALEQARIAAQAAVGEAKGGHLPTVNLYASAQESDIGYENTLQPVTDTYVVGVGVQIPLFSGGSTSGRVKAAYGDLMAAEQQYEALRREIEREVRTAYLSLQASVSKVSATERAVTSAQRAREAAEQGFSYGVLTAVDVLNAVQEEYRARRDFQQAQYEFIIGLLVLHRWGGALDADTVALANEWLAEPPATPEA